MNDAALSALGLGDESFNIALGPGNQVFYG